MKTILAFGCLLAACGTDRNIPDPGDPRPDAFVDPLPPPPAPGVQITSGQITVGAGEEKTFCVTFDLPTTAELPVIKMEQHNNGTAHHFILFRAASAQTPGTGPCPGGLFVQHPPIFPGTRNQGAFEMPSGVAITLGAHQSMILQLHLLNPTDEAVTEELRMNLYGGMPGEYTKAGIVGGSDFNFQIPPGGMHTETQRCTIPNALKLFALTSHSHARTISFDVQANLAGGPESIYHSTSWSEPEFAQYEPVKEIGALSWLEFSCTWFNETSNTIKYGETAADEMCMMFGFYYPATFDSTPCLGL